MIVVHLVCTFPFVELSEMAYSYLSTAAYLSDGEITSGS